jgi:hypothetical protein
MESHSSKLQISTETGKMTSRIPGAVNDPLEADMAPALNPGRSTGIEILEDLGVHVISSENTLSTKKKD